MHEMSAYSQVKEMLPEGVRRHLGRVRRAPGRVKQQLRTSPLHTRWQKAKLLSANSLDPAQRTLLRQAESRISSKDDMCVDISVGHYFTSGLSAMSCIGEALQQAGNTTINDILDMPSGSGRVLRLLAARFPHARIVACDVNAEAIRFCAETFGATPAQSSPNFDELSFPTKFDLIWCGSLITHLDADSTRALLRLFAKHLTAEGLVVLTTHGDTHAVRPTKVFGLDSLNTSHLLKGFHEQGHGYGDYPGGSGSGYGISFTTHAWMTAEALKVGLREVYFRADGWDKWQDVFGFVNASSR